MTLVVVIRAVGGTDKYTPAQPHTDYTQHFGEGEVADAARGSNVTNDNKGRKKESGFRLCGCVTGHCFVFH